MPPNQGNGAPPPGDPFGLSEAEVAQVRQAAQEQNVGMILMLLQALLPKVSPATLEGIVRGVVKQQEHEDFTKILDDATDPKARASHPIWGVQLFRRKAPKGAPRELLIKAPKDPSGIKTADEAVQYVTILGLVTNPTARAVLLALGYEPHFVQVSTSPIVTL